MKPETTIQVRGIGWLAGREWGGVLTRRRLHQMEGDDTPLWRHIAGFAYPVKNMGRCDATTRLTLCACLLALDDAGRAYAEGRKSGIGLLGTNAAGSLEANRAYFGDYLQAGRVMGRGNLFIYTLPSSPLAEAAIHFGFQGPLVYMGFPGGGAGALCEAAACMIQDGLAPAMVAVLADEREAVAFVLEPQTKDVRGLDRRRVADVAAAPGGAGGVRELVAGLEQATGGQGGV
jgi:3-oxoacyl-[acyl-carrier-protein] synthase II